MTDRPKDARLFFGVIAGLLAFYMALKWLGPRVGAWLPARNWFSWPERLPTSGFETALYMTLAVLAAYAWLSYREDRWEAFWAPVFIFLSRKSPARTAALAILPLGAGLWAFVSFSAGAGPDFTPIRHPTPPDEFSKLANPYRDPSPERLAAFDEKIKSGELNAESTTEEDVLKYIAAAQAGQTDELRRRRAFFRRTAEEGRLLFAVNCRPCHGMKAMGDGPLAAGLRRRPADFTGVETIATLVEGAVFWRIKTGGIGLPHEGAPWESAMPPWGRDLTDDDIWKIIIGEYDIAGNSPRRPERSE